ncbi:MAG: type IV secretory system conjugative DNA transfer family protein, partial [Clostridiales Family XIII bacterium]|nr:type IV secretory system conjugative DNA transfer family protein [Clostridiales Family XIII bacterium]
MKLRKNFIGQIIKLKFYVYAFSILFTLGGSFGIIFGIVKKIMTRIGGNLTLPLVIAILFGAGIITTAVITVIKKGYSKLPDKEEYEISMQNTQGGASQFSNKEIAKHYYIFKEYKDIPKAGGYYILGTLDPVNYTKNEIKMITKADDIIINIEQLRSNFLDQKRELIKQGKNISAIRKEYEEKKTLEEDKIILPEKSFEKDYHNFVCVPLKPKYSMARYTKNPFFQVIGTSGSGKTRGFMLTNIIQSILAGHSLFITDPSHEIYKYTAHIAKEFGYDINVLNLDTFDRSDGFNLFGMIADAPEQDRLTYAQIVVSMIIESTREEAAKVNAYWDTANESLFLGLALYISVSPYYKGERSFKELVRINSQE